MFVAYAMAQVVLNFMHEYLHSSVAWLTGYSTTPFTVVWGNIVTLQGWDEGVPYHALFPHPGNWAEAAIGGAPLLMHGVFLSASLWVLSSRIGDRISSFYIFTYWFAIMNLTELIAYVVMRPFIPGGDTGHFNRGLGLSPWYLFIIGTIFILMALWLLARNATPKLENMFFGGRMAHWLIVASSGFIMFLWGSGLRFLPLYPDPTWKAVFIGIAGFLGWLWAAGTSETRSELR